MLLTLALHGLLAALAPVLAGRVGRRVFAICALAPAATLAWAAAHGPALVAGGSVVERVTWAAALGIEVTLRVDALSLLMLGIVSGVGVLVLVYAVSYFHREPGLGRAAGALTAFAGAMAGLVVADNLFALYVFWELTSIASYVLIGFDDRDRQAREAAQHALLMTAGGGMAMLAGFVVLGQAAGSYSLSGILAAPPGGVGVGVGLGLVLVGAFTKSAQVPFHGWLPAAMAAPTPVSAYLHAASMVKAGVYLVARLAPAFAPAYPFWRPLVVVVGLATLVHGAVLALRQHDLKLLLAYGTVSQLGLMVALVGAGDPKLTAAGLAILLAHALYKAVLFLVVGIVEHEAGSRDIRVLEGAARAMPVTLALAAVSAASMMGIPPLFGYVAKEAALDNLVTLAGDAAAVAVLAAVVAGAALTVAYGARFLAGGFGDWWRSAEQQPKRPHGEVGPVLLAPAAVLAVLTVALGAAPALATAVLEPAAAVLDPAAAGTKLKLWHGVTPALGLSLLSLLLGAALFASRQAVGRLQTRAQRLPDAHEVFSSTVAAVVRLSARVTAVVQNGSLPVYLGVILLTAVVAPGLGLVRVATPRVDLAASPLQVAAAALLVVAATATARSGRRFVAVVYLGAVGYAMGLLFILHGAPDLALVQFAIETLTVLVFVLVLRHLPERFATPRSRWAFHGRLTLSAAVGLFVAAFAVVAAAARQTGAVSEAYLQRAAPEAEGHNVVNVILVDFRALDTLGEITVLTVAAFGVASLVAAGRPRRPATGSLRRLGESPPSLVMRTSVAALFPLALLFSLYLLFAGHNAPGGGFVGGLVAGAALVLRYLAGGPGELRSTVPLPAPVLLAGGLAVAVLTGAAGWLWGSALLESASWQAHLPLLGKVKMPSVLLFDIGVYVVVIGFVVTVLRTLGEEPAS